MFGAATAAELSARFLDYSPNKMLAWYLNYDCFHLFRMMGSETSLLRFLRGDHIIYAEIICVALILLAHVRKHRFGLGLFANLSLLLALSLTQVWLGESTRGTAFASLAMREHPYDAALVSVLLASSLLAAVTSHLAFIQAGLRGEDWRSPRPSLRTARALSTSMRA